MKKSVAPSAHELCAPALTLVRGLNRIITAATPPAAAKVGCHFTLRQIEMLIVIKPGDTNRDLRAQFGTYGSTVTRALDALEKAGLVTRRVSKSDERLTFLSRTRAGDAMVRRIANLRSGASKATVSQKVRGHDVAAAAIAPTKSAKQTGIAPVTAKNERKAALAQKVRSKYDLAADAIAA